MTEKNEKSRGKSRRLLWIGLSVLVLLLGLSPVLVLFTYTRGDLFWSRWTGNHPGESTREETTDPAVDSASFLVHYVYRYCDHSNIFTGEELPGDIPSPPQGLVEISLALLNSDLSLAGLAGSINVPDDWHLAELSTGLDKPHVLLSHIGDLCPECRGHHFLGLFGDYIAVYEGNPPRGKLVEVTGFKVKDIDRETLVRGVPFETEEEKRFFLESYTS